MHPGNKLLNTSHFVGHLASKYLFSVHQIDNDTSYNIFVLFMNENICDLNHSNGKVLNKLVVFNLLTELFTVGFLLTLQNILQFLTTYVMKQMASLILADGTILTLITVSTFDLQDSPLLSQ